VHNVQVVFGRMGVTLLTSNELANASNLVSTIIMTAGVHPQFRLQTVSTDDLLAQPLLRKKVDLAVQEGNSRLVEFRSHHRERGLHTHRTFRRCANMLSTHSLVGIVRLVW
jgi:hypothetical protein